MEKVTGEQSNICYKCTLNFPEIQTDVLLLLILATSNLAHFGIFDMLVPFLAFFKL